MIKLKIEGKKYNLPTCWEDVTFGQFIGLLGVTTIHERLSVILGFTFRASDKIQDMDRVLIALKFLDKEPAIDEKPFGIGDYVLPQDITYQTTEQYENTRAEIARVVATGDLKTQTEALALYAAIYCVSDMEQAKYLAKTFYDRPALEVLAAGSFFQAKCLSIASGKSMSFLRQNTLMKKSRPGLNRYLRRLGFTLHLTR